MFRFSTTASDEFSAKENAFEETEWEPSESDEEVFRFSEEAKSKQEMDAEEQEARGGSPTTNPRYEFQPHVRSMDQFHM